MANHITRKPGRREEHCSDKFIAVMCALAFVAVCVIVAIIEHLPE